MFVFVTILCVHLIIATTTVGLKLSDQTHYLDYLPVRQDSFLTNDFRTSTVPALHLRERKISIPPNSQRSVEDLLNKIVWPARWPYSYEDFRPVDYTRDEVTATDLQYEYSQRSDDRRFQQIT
jgi:hypothetical protein